jgi:hypothetical protein
MFAYDRDTNLYKKIIMNVCNLVSSYVPLAVTRKEALFWHVTPYIPVLPSSVLLGTWFLLNAGKYPPYDTYNIPNKGYPTFTFIYLFT